MPTVNPSPFGPKPQFEGTDGLPLVGGKLFFYAAGSSTKQNTYTDSTGGVANTNPLVLDAAGRPTTEIWFTAGQSYKLVLAPSTDTDPPTSPIFTVDNLRGINDTTLTLDQWVSGPTPTYVSATSFTLAGDQTSTFTPGRRVKTTNSGGTVYSTILTSAFGVLTTITLLNDSGTLDAGLSAVSYGLLSSTNVSFPASVQPVIYTWNASNPGDVVGGNANFANAGTFTGDTNLIAAVNSTGTVTFTLKKTGKYLCMQSWEGSNSTTYTNFNIKHDFGGSGTRYNTDDTIRDAGDSGSDELFAGSWVFLVSATANQTVSSLPQIQVTGGGTTANFTGYSQMTILYLGAQ